VSLATEMQRFVGVDIGYMHDIAGDSKKSVDSVTNAMRTFGLIDEDTAQWLAVGSSALQTIVGTSAMLKALRGLYEAKNAMLTAKAEALTALNLTNPAGWGKIALATATMVATGAAMYALVNEIEVGEFDLSTASGIDGMLGALEGIA
jgi:hypothetical protein